MFLSKSYDTHLNEENLQHLASKPAVSERQAANLIEISSKTYKYFY
jgi:hypothetical protein